MQIRKDLIKTITETAFVVNSYSKTYRNPKNCFLYLASKGDYLSGDFEQTKNGKYFCRMGNVGYTVTLKPSSN